MLESLQDRVRTAAAERRPLELVGHASKRFFGEMPRGEPWVLADEAALHGLRAHEPAELYVTVGAATPLQALEQHLAQHGQQLGFEPPRLGERGTVGGAVATGFSGPSRPYRGSLRDALLGLTLIDGQGQLLRFGGTVIKNVAGFDVTRLMAGAMGTLGLIVDVSFKLLPLDALRRTLRFEASQADALHAMNQAAAQGLPLSASAWWNGSLLLRLGGSPEAVDAAARRLGGETVEPAVADAFWAGLRHQGDEFFVGAVKALTAGSGVSLWRLSLPPTAPVLQAPGEQLVEWGGALRWLVTPLDGAQVRALAERAGGAATLYASARRGEWPAFPPANAVNQRITERLRAQFDPAGIFNPGRAGT